MLRFEFYGLGLNYHGLGLRVLEGSVSADALYSMLHLQLTPLPRNETLAQSEALTAATTLIGFVFRLRIKLFAADPGQLSIAPLPLVRKCCDVT